MDGATVGTGFKPAPTAHEPWLTVADEAGFVPSMSHLDFVSARDQMVQHQLDL